MTNQPGDLHLSANSVPQPAPPTFTPADRYVEAGDCRRLGHAFVFSTAQQNWRCALCQHVAPAGRPAPTVPVGQPLYPMPDPIRLDPQPGWTPNRVLPMTNPAPRTFPQATHTFRPGGPVRGAGQRCLFLDLPESERGKAMGLACPCPLHSAWC